mmetsp:Transcript_29236/g.67810  ORF Transcript_29236/g.67810 Transcript_29236/m.67810 type:complete len:110 (-) Transcript_29236:5016-5345(-)
MELIPQGENDPRGFAPGWLSCVVVGCRELSLCRQLLCGQLLIAACVNGTSVTSAISAISVTSTISAFFATSLRVKVTTSSHEVTCSVLAPVPPGQRRLVPQASPLQCLE